MINENSTKKVNLGVGLVTPSAPLPALFPDRFKRGVDYLENLGFTVKCGAHVSTKEGAVAASSINRAHDINCLFGDEDVTLVMATIGGDYSAEILPYLDWEVICKNKKGMVGYSDITILLHAIGIKAQQIVFYGPTLMTEFSEYPKAPSTSEKSFLQVFDDSARLEILPFDLLMEKGSDWALPPKERNFSCPVFQKTIRSGRAQGIVMGGCIEALERLRGTEFWPSFNGAILLLETAEDEFDEKKWRCLIADYINMGIFKKIAGVIIGQKMWRIIEVEKLSSMLLEATNDTEIPILYGLPFGHISPIATFPLFTRATLDADAMTLVYDKPFRYEYPEE